MIESEDRILHIFPSCGSSYFSQYQNSTDYRSFLTSIILDRNQKIIDDKKLLKIIDKITHNLFEVQIAFNLYKISEIYGIPMHKFLTGSETFTYSDIISRIAREMNAELSNGEEIRISDIPSISNMLSLDSYFKGLSFVIHGELPETFKKMLNGISNNVKFDISRKNELIKKIKFPDYTTENHYILKTIIENRSKKIGIVVPDYFSEADIILFLKANGINPTILTPMPKRYLENFPIEFIKNMLLIAADSSDSEVYYSLLHDFFSPRSKEGLYKIRKEAFENSIIDDKEDWLKLISNNGGSSLVQYIRKLSNAISKGINDVTIDEVLKILDGYFINYIPEHAQTFREISEIISIIRDKITNINDLTYALSMALSFLSKGMYIGDESIIIGRPEEISGLELDIVLSARMDSSSFNNITLPEIMSYLRATGIYEYLLQEIMKLYLNILIKSRETYLLYSSFDNTMKYTASSEIYDSVKAEEVEFDRIQFTTSLNYVISSDYPKRSISNKYKLSKENIEKITSDFSPTALENFLVCPFKYFVENIMGYRKIDEVSEFLGIMEAGSLTHELLQYYYDPEKGPSIFLERSNDKLKELIQNSKYNSKKKALDLYCSKYLRPNRLARFIELDAKITKQMGRTLYKKEQKFNGKNDGIFFELEDIKIPIKGVVDRIDQNRDGTLTVIDYKGSLYKFPKDKLCDERSIQLYIYKYAVEKLFNNKVTAAAYVSYRDYEDGAINSKGHYMGIPPEDEAKEVKECQGIVLNALRKLISGDFRAPIENNENLKICYDVKCTFYNACRIQELRW